MFFLWPRLLWLTLTLAAVLPLAYWWLLRRRARSAVRWSHLGIARAAMQGRQWRRHVPPAIVMLACVLLAFAAARPVARVLLPWSKSTIMLAMDVSLSMRVPDVKPTRMQAAQQAAKQFLQELPKHVEVGLVTFAGSSQVAQRATLDREALAATIDGIQMQWGTAVGSAIVVCLAELFPDQGIDVGTMTFGGRPSAARSLDDRAKPPPKEVKPVAPGSYDSAAIILLSDGRRTTGVDTLAAAKMAADRGVRIYVIGLGTVDGPAAYGEGFAIYMQLDEPTLREVARMTGGEYHYAGTAEQLRGVYQHLGSRVQVQVRETEVTGLLTLVAALLVVCAGVLSMVWFGRIV
ncbi:MAG TPA: VWA domain-containing protein [Ramlibacter sp.]|uniref:VWA domain-containing protein n=1 Tax=Ramlibacter sp. TaxID=1917967 RepID=UPI002BFE8AF3|nr:VWA domain-containing protein [Ramlibacter sp.]HVZ42607.1 VWA domain-containing protein [Ramlibacter sp.]